VVSRNVALLRSRPKLKLHRLKPMVSRNLALLRARPKLNLHRLKPVVSGMPNDRRSSVPGPASQLVRLASYCIVYSTRVGVRQIDVAGSD
jgi:hypothetical protein